ncbi:MAG: uroporphyrinogen-III synthase [Candidatus Dormibacteria bacterium]
MTGPLRGRQVLVTRARHQAPELVGILREHGATPISVPVMRLQPLVPQARLQELGQEILRGRWDDLVFTSANGVGLILPQLASGTSQPSRLFCIGPGTAARAARVGWRPEDLPEAFIAESLVERLQGEAMAQRRTLLARAQGARDVLPRALRQMGASLTRISLYRMLPELKSKSALRDALADPQLSAILFLSGSSVHCFETLRAGAPLPKEVVVGCIGPITAQAAREVGMSVDVVAKEHTVPGLVAALELGLAASPENVRS